MGISYSELAQAIRSARHHSYCELAIDWRQGLLFELLHTKYISKTRSSTMSFIFKGWTKMNGSSLASTANPPSRPDRPNFIDYVEVR